MVVMVFINNDSIKIYIFKVWYIIVFFSINIRVFCFEIFIFLCFGVIFSVINVFVF